MIPSVVRRPSHKELTGKIKAAIGLFDTGRWAPARPEKLLANFVELGLFSATEQRNAIRNALGAISPECYRGRYPPEKSYEPATEGAELFAFSWHSAHFGMAMHVKFAVFGRGKYQRLFIYSLHEDRPPRKGTGR